MEYPAQIVFRNMDPSSFVEQAANRKIDKFVKTFPYIIHIRVIIDAPHHHKHLGQTYQVRIMIKVPRDEIVVSHDFGKFGQHQDLYVALRDAFNAAMHRMHEYHGKLKGEVKHHEPLPAGHIIKLFPQQGYGFVETDDGREVYFDQNSVFEGDFDRLEIGQKVRMAIESGENGPQASTVHADKKFRKRLSDAAI
jgi:cold shock CspA family protein